MVLIEKAAIKELQKKLKMSKLLLLQFSSGSGVPNSNQQLQQAMECGPIWRHERETDQC